jgi:hypothetical protein
MLSHRFFRMLLSTAIISTSAMSSSRYIALAQTEKEAAQPQHSQILPGKIDAISDDDRRQIPSGTRNYAIFLTGPAQPIKQGTPIELHVVLFNLSNAPVTVLFPDTNYDAEVRDESGKIVIKEPSNPDEGSGSVLFLTVNPNQKLVEDELLPKEFRHVMPPGTYTIRLCYRQKPQDGLMDWSNTISLVIAP